MKLRYLSLIMLIPLLAIPMYAHGVSPNTEYIFSSEEYFLVFGLDEDYNVTPMNGGVNYAGQWQIFNMTDVNVRQLDDKGEVVWLEDGKLENSETKFWFTWNLEDSKLTGVWLYDDGNLVDKIDNSTNLSRFF